MLFYHMVLITIHCFQINHVLWFQLWSVDDAPNPDVNLCLHEGHIYLLKKVNAFPVSQYGQYLVVPLEISKVILLIMLRT